MREWGRLVLCGIVVFSSTWLARAEVSLTDHKSWAKAAERKEKSKPGQSTGRAMAITSLIDGSGLEWDVQTNTTGTDISASGSVDDATYTTTVTYTTSLGGTATTNSMSDAFDDYNGLLVDVNGSGFVDYTNNGAATLEGNGQQLDFNTQTISGIAVSRKVFVPNNDEFCRWLNIFTNNTGSTATIVARIRGNLGSDTLTTIFNSSDADTIAEVTDNWVGTSQNFDTDPRLGHILQGPFALVTLSSITITNGNDSTTWDYTFSIAAGATRIIMNYATGQLNRPDVVTQSNQIVSDVTNYTPSGSVPVSLNFMSATEILEVANFGHSADLSITKTDSADPVTRLNSFTYTVAITNGGPTDATGVAVVDTLPVDVTVLTVVPSQGTYTLASNTLTWTVGALANGASASIAITVQALNTGPLFNTATVSANEDFNSANNTDTETTDVVGLPPDLTTQYIWSIRPYNKGRKVKGAFWVQNYGETTAGASVVGLYLSSNTTLDAGDRYMGTYNVPALAPLAAQKVVFKRKNRTSMIGKYLIADVDAGLAVAEGNETNNEVARKIR